MREAAYNLKYVRHNIFRRYARVVFEECAYVGGKVLDGIIIPCVRPLVSCCSRRGHSQCQ